MKPICTIKLKYYPFQSYEEVFLSSLRVIIKADVSEPWLRRINMVLKSQTFVYWMYYYYRYHFNEKKTYIYIYTDSMRPL